MKKKTFGLMFGTILFLGLVWPTAYAVVGDFYPQYEHIKEVLYTKSIINGLLLITVVCFMPLIIPELKD